MDKPKGILVIQTAFLGDCILTFPLIEQLHKTYPDSQLIFLCRRGFGDFIQSCFPYVKAIEIIKSSTKSYRIKKKHIRDNFKLNSIFCVHNSFRSFRFAQSLPADNKIFFSSLYKIFCKETVVKNHSYPEALRVLQLLGKIDNSINQKLVQYESKNLKSPYESIAEDFKVKLNITQRPNPDFNLPHQYIVMAPGSIWNTKKWPAEKFSKLAKTIETRLNLPVVLMGSIEDQTLSDTITQITPSVLSLVGKTSLLDCKSIIAYSSGFVGNDSGLGHMAALFDVPSVAVFGPTHENLGFRPWQNYSTIASLNLPCSPCGTHGSEECPIDTHECMKDLEPYYVYYLLSKMMKKSLSKQT